MFEVQISVIGLEARVVESDIVVVGSYNRCTGQINSTERRPDELATMLRTIGPWTGTGVLECVQQSLTFINLVGYVCRIGVKDTVLVVAAVVAGVVSVTRGVRAVPLCNSESPFSPI
jgi:hypothetical protein